MVLVHVHNRLICASRSRSTTSLRSTTTGRYIWTQLAFFALGQMAQMIQNLDVIVELHNAVRPVNTVERAGAAIVRACDDDNRGVFLLWEISKCPIQPAALPNKRPASRESKRHIGAQKNSSPASFSRVPMGAS